VIAAALEELHERVLADAVVLDVGGWAKPLARADWVIDLQPYETRGLYGYDGDRGDERFSADTWVIAAIWEPWPFADGRFDVAICSHTLEDVRDPVGVCRELMRVARSGYVEVPSRLEEQTMALQGDWVGWSHHRWLIDVDPAAPAIEFAFKPPILHLPGFHFPPGFAETLDAEERVGRFWWDGAFAASERVFSGHTDQVEWIQRVVRERGVPAGGRRRWGRRGR